MRDQRRAQHPQPGPPLPWQMRWFSVAAAVFVAVIATLTAILGSSAVSQHGKEMASDIAMIPMPAFAAICGRWRARRTTGRTQHAWYLVSLMAVSLTVAGLAAYFNRHLASAPASPLVADVFYLAAFFPAAVALLLFPQLQRPGSERVRTLLGALVVGGSVLFVGRAMSLQLLFPVVDESSLAHSTYVAYLIADVVLTSLALIMLVRLGPDTKLHHVLIASGFVAFGVADLLHAHDAALGQYEAGSLLDLGWIVGYALFTLAALAPQERGDAVPTPRTTQERYTGVSSLIVYVPMLAAVAVACARPSPVTDPLLVVSGLGILVLFGVRQALLSMDNSRLRNDLQCQVAELETRSSELRRLAMQNERIVQSVVDGVFGVDAQGRVTFVNARAAEMLGYSQAALLQITEDQIFSELTKDPAAVDRLVPTALLSGTVVPSVATEFVRRDGSVFPVELAVGPIIEAGVITGAVVVFRDVSARRAVEKMKNEFVSVVSHELRTPLTSIRGSLGLISAGLGGTLTTHGQRMVSIALESSERLTRLIEDMLDLERMESGALTMSFCSCELWALVDAAIGDVRALALEHDVVIDALEISGSVRADPDRVVQTLTNLLGNAIKFSPAGGRITISAVRTRDMMEIAVSDEGRGIPPDKIARIFERFEQVDSSDSRELGGTGLGLTISRDIVRMHGGRIWAVSELGHGSTFRFTLPISTAAPVGSRSDSALLVDSKETM
jgi:PAS domain S-box-containing protein